MHVFYYYYYYYCYTYVYNNNNNRNLYILFYRSLISDNMNIIDGI